MAKNNNFRKEHRHRVANELNDVHWIVELWRLTSLMAKCVWIGSTVSQQQGRALLPRLTGMSIMASWMSGYLQIENNCYISCSSARENSSQVLGSAVAESLLIIYWCCRDRSLCLGNTSQDLLNQILWHAKSLIPNFYHLITITISTIRTTCDYISTFLFFQVCISMHPKSLALWSLGILAEDITGPRVAITYRELTPEITATEIGRMALERARQDVWNRWEAGGKHGNVRPLNYVNMKTNLLLNGWSWGSTS